MKVQTKISVITVMFLLGASVAGSANAQSFSSTATTTSFTFARNLTLGARGDDVSALQKFLIDKGFLNISTSTGLFGRLTKQSLGAWQASVGISPAVGFLGQYQEKKLIRLFWRCLLLLPHQQLHPSPLPMRFMVVPQVLALVQ